MPEHAERIQAQFGATAAAYVTSVGHAGGDDLDRLLAWGRALSPRRVLDVATGVELSSFGDFNKNGTKIAVAPDGERVLVPCWSHVELWDLHRAEQRAVLSAEGETGIRMAASTPDGRWLITGSLERMCLG